MLIQIYSYLVSKLKSSNESMRKTSKQHIWLDEIEAFLENKMLLFHIPSKLNVLQSIILCSFFSSPKI